MVVIASFQEPESAIRLRQPEVNVILDKQNLGVGTLFVSERTLCWQKEGGDGFSMEYPHVSLHAVSRDPSVHNRECIYILTDPRISLGDQQPNQNASEDSGSDNDEDDEQNLSEILLVPEQSSHVQTIYDAIKVCQELNPDPIDVEDDDDDDEDDNLYADAEEEMYVEGEAEDDNAINNLAERMQNHSVDIEYNYRNGSGHADDQFEDAD